MENKWAKQIAEWKKQGLSPAEIETSLDTYIEDLLRKARFSLAVDGFTIKEHHTKLVRKKLKGEISEAEFLEEALRLAKEKNNERS
ncbi:hypothetical protein [Bacillus taeanensis]|uniref:hypothetical protein n=1 Tax=Bacillus taeanensis TaxID=273032 RepID=UPI0015F0DFDE|nr:hypothetical protein [Bacillus taeanensis]